MNIYTPYTYLIGWSALQKFYYGVRYAKNCHPTDLWVTYFTSSNHVAKFRKIHGDPDIIQVRKIFPNNSEKAKIWEEKVLRKMNVINDQRFLNRNVNGRFLKEGPQDKEHVAKRTKSMIETKIKRGNLHKISWTKENNPKAAENVKKGSVRQKEI